MAVFVWDEKYAVGIAEIDNQHQRLVRMINDLHEALVAEQGQEALADIVGRMLDYAAYHFATEESLLKNHGFPLFGSHQREHEGFTAKAQEYKRRIDRKGFVLTLEVIHFLKDWLSDHILVNDKKYAPFLIRAGVR
jgi:hemerythrin